MLVGADGVSPSRAQTAARPSSLPAGSRLNVNVPQGLCWSCAGSQAERAGDRDGDWDGVTFPAATAVTD